MIRKIHILGLFFLLFLFIGTVSANEDSNLTNSISTDGYSLQTSDIEMYYKDGTSFNVRLLNDNQPIIGEKVNLTINGVTYGRTTNSSGMAKLNLNLMPGEYSIKTDSILNNQKLSVLNTIKIKEMNTSLLGESVLDLPYKEGKYDVKLIGGDNKPLSGKVVYFTINGVDYRRTTDEFGVASININLNPKSYVISARFSENFHKSSSIVSTLNVGIFNTRFISNSAKFNKNNVEYSVKLVYGDAKPVVNRDVLFNVNGMLFNVKTDNNGVATFKNTLVDGFYKVNFEFKGSNGFYSSSAYNTIEVNTDGLKNDLLVETNNIEMFFRDGTAFNVRVLKNGEVISNQKVTIAINGVSYSRTTDSLGMAKLNLNLAPRDYEVKTTCLIDNREFVIYNSVVIKEMPTKLISDSSVELGYKQGKYDVKLFDNNNRPLSGKVVYFTINGVDYKRTTDDLGVASININLNPGSYVISARFSENFYKSSTIASTINVGVFNTRFISNSTKYDKINVEYSVKLVDNNNRPVKNVLVLFSVGMISKGVYTDAEGIATFKEVLNPGIYKISFEFRGNVGYLKSSGSSTLDVLNNKIDIVCEDFETFVDSPLYYQVYLKDSDNNKLVNVTVKSDIYQNNKLIKSIQSKTYEDGIARINLGLNPGEYLVKNYFMDNSNFNFSKVTIKPASLVAVTSDLTLNRKGESYTVILKNNETNNPIANQVVYISVNGVEYKRTTDEYGSASLRINLNWGDYAIGYRVEKSDKYGGLSGTNHIKMINAVLNPTVEFLTSEIIRKGTYCEVKLTDVNSIPLKNKVVHISVNNIAYKKITDDNGIAKLRISLNDGDYVFRAFFEGDELFKQAIRTAHIKVNTTPTFEYSLEIDANIEYNGFVCPIIREFKIDYNGVRYELAHSGDSDCPKISEKNSYFINNKGLSSFNEGSQGLEFKLANGKIQFIFYGKTEKVGQFSVILLPDDEGMKIDYIVDNEVVATVYVSSAYGYYDYYKLLDLGYSFLSFDKCQSVFKQGDHEIKREVSFDSHVFRTTLKNHPTFSDFDTIQTYLLTSEKIDSQIMENKVNDAFNFNNGYSKYAYELYLSSLMTMWSSDTFADEFAKQLNLTWNKNNQIILTSIDWAKLTLDSHLSINAFGNQTNVRLFKMQYGLSYSSCEQFGIKSTYNDASSVVGDIFRGIYEGKDFVIDEKGNTLTLRLVNSSDSININVVTGDTNVTKVTDIETISSNMVLKGCECIFYISKSPKVEELFGVTLNAFKRSSEDILDLVFSVNPRRVSSILQDQFKNLATLGVSYKYGYAIHPIAALFLGIDFQQFTLDYRNKFAADDKWQYFSSHGATWDVKTIAIVNNRTGYVDYVEIPYDGDNLNMGEARYIDSITGKRNLTNQEKIKYRDYDVFAEV